MKVKRFYGDNMPDLLGKVKSELGSEAIIIQSRKVRQGGILGIFGPSLLEVIAAADSDNRKVLVDSEQDCRLEQLRLIQNDAVSRQVSELKKILEENMPAPSYGKPRRVFPGCFEQIFQVLLSNDVGEGTAREIIDRAMYKINQSRWQDLAAIKADVLEIITDYFKEYISTESKEKERIALVGPTGVGKTTTLAKLAAIASVLKEKKVALITIDTFRVAALEQLRTYADIISVSMDVAHTPKELKSLLDKHQDKDLVLVDTAGRSPYNKLQIAEIKGFLDACPELKIYLVLNVATNQKDLNEIILSFEKFSIAKLIFTKLDETHRYGTILNIVAGFKKELAYVTTGQNVPDDIEIPTPVNIAQLVLREG